MFRYDRFPSFHHILIIVFAFWLTSLKAQNVFTAKPGSEPVRMGSKFLYLRDATHNLSREEALKSSAWKPDTDEIPNFDVTKDVLWAKIKLTCTKDADWYLGMIPSEFNNIIFYQKRAGNPWTETKAGGSLPANERPNAVNEIFVNLDLHTGDTTLLMFRLQDYYPMQLNISIGESTSFLKFFQDMNLYNGLCYGVMLMMLIYNLYLYLTQKERIYLYYVLYVTTNGIFTLVFNGNFMYLPGFFKSFILFDPIVFPASFGIFLILFTIELFKGFLSKKYTTFLYVFMWLVAADPIIAIFDKHLAFDIIRFLGLLLGVVCFASGIIALRKRSPSAVFYIIGFGAYLGSLIFIILSGPVFPISAFALRAIVTGGAIESVFLSFAQGDKLKFVQQEREKARNETVLQMQKNEILIKEQNTVLEQKVKERTAELAEKNKEVTDSIQYARRIQGTLLADTELLEKYVPNHFIIFKPKDIVSGDFYWAANKEGVFYLAVCDSTGHGVPGAFMSLLNISFLNEAITEKNITAPSEAFNYVRTHLISSISRDGGKDGMDGILIAISPNGSQDTVTLRYAASNNNPMVVRGTEVIELPADKMPVGQGEVMNSFALHEFTLKKGDALYLFTDGYADQFGGPKGKKFKYKPLNDKLLAISQKPMAVQKTELDDTFEEWKGNLEQVDDVLIIGIRI